MNALVEDEGDLGQLVVIGNRGEQAGGLAPVGAGETRRRGESGMSGGGVETFGVETQSGVPTHDRAIEPRAVGVGVDEAEA